MGLCSAQASPDLGLTDGQNKQENSVCGRLTRWSPPWGCPASVDPAPRLDHGRTAVKST